MINWDEIDDLNKNVEWYAKHPITSRRDLADKLKQLLGFLNQFRPRSFNPDDRMTWPEMETEVLVRFDFGWRIAKLCYSVMFRNPAWKTDNEKLDYTAGIEWQPLPPIDKEEQNND